MSENPREKQERDPLLLMPREEAFMEILRLLHRRWRLSILAPMAYLLSGLIIQKFAFQTNDMAEGLGIFSTAESQALRWLGLILVGGIGFALWKLLQQQYADLALHGDHPRAFLVRAKRHQLFQLALCDAVNLPGIALFLFAGDEVALLLFALASLILFLIALPSGKKLGIAMFRSGRSI